MTGTERPPLERWYDDACGAALALDLVGERWALLILRELMFGGRRFSELRAGLPGVSANVLTQRLAGLERIGALTRRRLPPPASAQVYELTAWGYEAEPILIELGRWATRSPLQDPTRPLSAASIVMSLSAMHRPANMAGESARIGLVLGDDAFVVEVDPRGVKARRERETACPARLTTTPAILGALLYGGLLLEDAEDADEARIEGDKRLIARFLRWFALPPRIDARASER